MLGRLRTSEDRFSALISGRKNRRLLRTNAESFRCLLEPLTLLTISEMMLSVRAVCVDAWIYIKNVQLVCTLSCVVRHTGIAFLACS